LSVIDRVRSNVHLLFDVFNHCGDNKVELKSKIEKITIDAKTNIVDLQHQTEQMKSLLTEKADTALPHTYQSRSTIESLRTQSEKRTYATMSLNAELERHGFNNMRAKKHKISHEPNPRSKFEIGGITTKQLNSLLKQIQSQVENKGFIIKNIENDGGVTGIMIEQTGVCHIIICFKEPIVSSRPHRLDISRGSVCGFLEERSVWVPSKWKTWRKMTQAMMQAILEHRIRYPSDQLIKIIDWITKYNYSAYSVT